MLPALTQNHNYWPTQGWRIAPPEEQSFDIGNNDHAFLRFRFEGNRVVAQVQETDHETSATVEGRIVNP